MFNFLTISKYIFYTNIYTYFVFISDSEQLIGGLQRGRNS